MNYRILGNSNLDISEIGFGCMSLGDSTADNISLVHKALDKGINFFDTADLYQHGQNEAQLGKALEGRREDAIIATKVGNQWKSDGSGWVWNTNKDYILKAVEESLRRLKTDYIDLYQLHGGTMEDPVDDIIETFELLQQQGKIRYYGISSIRPNVIREYVKRSNITSVMMQYSLLDRRPEESMLPLLNTEHIGLLVRGAIAKGLLAGKPAEPYFNYKEEEIRAAANTVASLSGPERSSAQTALRFVLEQPMVSSAVVGIRTLPQLEEVAGVSDTPMLTAAGIQMLRNALAVNYYDQYR
ncbi:aldo/keto reductase [Chitinophaga oryziterrae]|uniref:Aldo/keto reductase n=1 Tax=Chitinophaga oryziterrae TaxID=1031224 RepID=A0A6N8J699_9BACT|nr:aldo/keto reductase [Chitinophaga oryziterrae]MVT40464.1 aldo/keto reductase [Chitinophaga oryziterrae]